MTANSQTDSRTRVFIKTGGLIGLSLLKLYALWLTVCFVGRLALFVWQHARLSDISPATQAMAFIYGWRMDTILLSYFLVPVMLVLTLWPALWSRVAASAVRIWALLLLLLLVFVEIASFPFFAEYDVRPNILFVEYLKYPHEVLSLLWKDQKLNLGIALVALSLIAFTFIRSRVFSGLNVVLQSPWWARAIWCLPLLVVLFFGIRSSLDHRPACTPAIGWRMKSPRIPCTAWGMKPIAVARKACAAHPSMVTWRWMKPMHASIACWVVSLKIVAGHFCTRLRPRIQQHVRAIW
jgi:hypothetical protein